MTQYLPKASRIVFKAYTDEIKAHLEGQQELSAPVSELVDLADVLDTQTRNFPEALAQGDYERALTLFQGQSDGTGSVKDLHDLRNLVADLVRAAERKTPGASKTSTPGARPEGRRPSPAASAKNQAEASSRKKPSTRKAKPSRKGSKSRSR